MWVPELFKLEEPWNPVPLREKFRGGGNQHYFEISQEGGFDSQGHAPQMW